MNPLNPPVLGDFCSFWGHSRPWQKGFAPLHSPLGDVSPDFYILTSFTE